MKFLRPLLFLSMLWLASCGSPLHPFQPKICAGGRAEALCVSPANDQLMLVASETGGLFRSEDGGHFWFQVSENLSYHFTDVAFHPENDRYAVASARAYSRTSKGGGLYYSRNHGKTWERGEINNSRGNPYLRSLSVYSVDYDPFLDRFLAGSKEGILSSTDQGETWRMMPPGQGFNRGEVRQVLSFQANGLLALNGSTPRVSTDNGLNWAERVNGLPTQRRSGRQHNQLAVAFLPEPVFFFASRAYDSINGEWEQISSLHYSTDLGRNWIALAQFQEDNRAPSVTVTRRSLKDGQDFDVYFTDGACRIMRCSGSIEPELHFSDWEDLRHDHCDITDFGFASDGKTPLLMTSDGGIHHTLDRGKTWFMHGNGPLDQGPFCGDLSFSQKDPEEEDSRLITREMDSKIEPHGGYNALQITEVTGQELRANGSTEVYFGTQDNHIWASADNGRTWTGKAKHEGFYLEILRERSRHPQHPDQITYQACADCTNRAAGPVLQDQRPWNNPAGGEKYAPVIYRPGRYTQAREVEDSGSFYLSRLDGNAGDTWRDRQAFDHPVASLPLIADDKVFVVEKNPRQGGGVDSLSLQRLQGFFHYPLERPAIQSSISGIKNIGLFPTMFAWYEVFGVDPNNANFMLVPDIVDQVVKVTTNGGLTWETDPDLTDLVTEGGKYLFSFGLDGSREFKFSQITSIGFNPNRNGHILIGTSEAGIFQTFNHGRRWKKIKGSERLPLVSDFFFPGGAEIFVSSYGRGLWKMEFKPPREHLVEPDFGGFDFERPVYWFEEAFSPAGDLRLRDDPRYRHIVVRGGELRSLSIDTSSGKVTGLKYEKGKVVAYDLSGQETKVDLPTEEIKKGKRFQTDNKVLSDFLRKTKGEAYGLLVYDDYFMGLILHDEEPDPKELAQIYHPGPQLRIEGIEGEFLCAGSQGKLSLIGKSFTAGDPLQVFVEDDEKPLLIIPAPRENGSFAVELPDLWQRDEAFDLKVIRQGSAKKEVWGISIPWADCDQW